MKFQACYPLSCFSVFVVVTDSGQWIDLPHVKNGLKPSENELGLANSGAYLEEGPTVEEFPYQV